MGLGDFKFAVVDLKAGRPSMSAGPGRIGLTMRSPWARTLGAEAPLVGV